MTRTEVIDELSMKMALATKDIDNLEIYKWFIREALTIGIVCFTKEMTEIIALNDKGVILGSFKGVRDASLQLKVNRGNIYQVLQGRRHSAHGIIFIRSKDYQINKI